MKNSIFAGQITALVSFIIGSLIFLVYLLAFRNLSLALVGLLYTIFAFFTNIFVLFRLLYLAYNYPGNRREILETCGLMILNIPVVIVYLIILKTL